MASFAGSIAINGWLFTLIASTIIALKVHLLVLPCPHGLARLALCMPSFIFLLALPLLAFDPHDDILGVALISWTSSWLASFKLAALCFGRGQLAQEIGDAKRSRIGGSSENAQHVTPSILCFARLFAGLFLPIHLVAPQEQQQWQWLLLRGSFKFVLMMLGFSLYSQSHAMPRIVLHLLHALNMFLFVTVLCELMAGLASAFLGFSIGPLFDQPYLANSFADFWGRRWNVTVSACLKTSIYEPLMELLCGTADPKSGNKAGGWLSFRAAKFVAIGATFLVSGVMHEFIIFTTSGKVTGEWTLFFFINGVLTAWERVGRRLVGMTLPRPLEVAFTLFALMSIAHYLFFTPVEKLGLDVRAVNQVRSVLGQT